MNDVTVGEHRGAHGGYALLYDGIEMVHDVDHRGPSFEHFKICFSSVRWFTMPSMVLLDHRMCATNSDTIHDCTVAICVF